MLDVQSRTSESQIAQESKSTPIFEVEDLHLHYLTRFGDKIPAVSGVSFSMQKGEILGVAGESGCGKSTLVNGCMGLFIPPLNPTSGDVG